MATNNVSDIVSGSIDGEYPVAGVDNDTQGFRDNFSIIKSNFATAQSEITDLYQRTPKLDEENNFDGSIITQASMKANTETVHTPGTFTQPTAVVDFINGHYQIIKVNTPDSIEIALEGWPQIDDQVAKMRVQLSKLSNTENPDPITVNWVTASGTIKIDSSNWPNNSSDPELTLDDSDLTVIIDFWSPDKGSTIFAHYIGTFA